MRKGSRWWRFAGLALAFALIATACGGDDEGASGGENCTQVDDVKVQLQWFAQSQFGGYYAALDQGFYADECLNVEILEGGVDIVPQQVLATGGAEFGIAWVPKALVSRESGGRHREHRPGVPTLRDARGVVGRLGDHPSP